MGPTRWVLPTCLALTLGGCGESSRESSSSGGSGRIGGSRASGGGPSGGNAGSSAGATGGAVAGGASSGGLSSGGTNVGGASGEPSTGGTGGSGGTPDVCSIEITGTLSEQIPTVGVVEWSTDLPGLTAARIEFFLDDPGADEVNVGSGGPISVSEQRALLLGLKPDRSYTYRIVASAGETDCISTDQKLQTPATPEAPEVTRVLEPNAASRAKGFIMTCTNSGRAVIYDTDGDVVWWTDAPPQCSRVHMDWAGEFMWMLAANPGGTDDGAVTRARMDGSGSEMIPGLERSHHDFAVLPDGVTAFLLWDEPSGVKSSSLVERSSDGTLRTVARLDDSTYLTVADGYHANALRYYAALDGYTVSDLNAVRIAKLDREGRVEWQLGTCEGAPPSQCAEATVTGSHGHELLENGNVLVFLGYNLATESSRIYEYSIGQVSGALTATLEWSYVAAPGTRNLGDVERLPNDNTLVTYSDDATIHEVSPFSELVQTLTAVTNTWFGYVSFRETLYGPPQ